MHVAFGSSRYHVVTLRYKNCDVTSWGSRSRLLARAIVNVQAPGDRKNPSVLWLKYIEDIYFFEVNTKYISSSVLKTSEFS